MEKVSSNRLKALISIVILSYFLFVSWNNEASMIENVIDILGFSDRIPLQAQVHSPDYCSKLGLKATEATKMYHLPEQRYNDKGMCRSRYEQQCFWARSNHKASDLFREELRRYEAMHRICAEEGLAELREGKRNSSSGCKFVVWFPRDGLGNRIISLTSAFVYSLLTNRTLLINGYGGIDNLFCEPFPNSTWLIPKHFPLPQGIQGAYFYNQTLTYMRQNGWQADLNQIRFPEILDVVVDNPPMMMKEDERFFCPAEQDLINNIPWIHFMSNNYVVPGYYFVPKFRIRLNHLFPDQAVFLHVARFLFSPRDEVWEQVVEYYNEILRNADKRLGIQIRSWWDQYHTTLNVRATNCATNMWMHVENVTSNVHLQHKDENIAIIVTSMKKEHYENISNFFMQNPINGKVIKVYTPSSETTQRTGDHEHDTKAVKDMWLLSFMDDVITSAQSTFGDVAHGLWGMEPLVFTDFTMHYINDLHVPNPPCKRSINRGPCFMNHPQNLACPLDSRGGVDDPYKMVPEVGHCELEVGIGLIQK